MAEADLGLRLRCGPLAVNAYCAGLLNAIFARQGMAYDRVISSVARNIPPVKHDNVTRYSSCALGSCLHDVRAGPGWFPPCGCPPLKAASPALMSTVHATASSAYATFAKTCLASLTQGSGVFRECPFLS